MSEWLGLREYRADFWQRFWSADGSRIWKLERGQFFREPGYPVWEAFDRGDWEESKRLLEAQRAEFAAEHRRMAAQGITLSWVRVVEQPVTDYVRWNLQVLRLRSQYGIDARCLDAAAIADREVDGPLPDLVAIDQATLYELRYDTGGTLLGAHRHSDRELVGEWRRELAALYEAGSVAALQTDPLGVAGCEGGFE